MSFDPAVVDVVLAYGDAGKAEQPASFAVFDSARCPCWSCPIKATCTTECQPFRAYVAAPVRSGCRRRNHSATCMVCSVLFQSVRPGAQWCSDICRVKARRKRHAAKA